MSLLKAYESELKEIATEEDRIAQTREEDQSLMIKEAKARTGRFKPHDVGLFESSDGATNRSVTTALLTPIPTVGAQARFTRSKEKKDGSCPPVWSYPHRFRWPRTNST